jgi:hypothetical protein
MTKRAQQVVNVFTEITLRAYPLLGAPLEAQPASLSLSLLSSHPRENKDGKSSEGIFPKRGEAKCRDCFE